MQFTNHQKLMIPRPLSVVIISDHPDTFITHFSEGHAGETCPFFPDFLRYFAPLLFILTSLSPLASKYEVNYK